MSTPSPATERGHFPATHWSVVRAAAGPAAPAAAAALEHLCQAYWYPLYVFIRRQGHAPADAQDLTQTFFAQLLEKNWIRRADNELGRFRSFLLMALKRFLANEWDKVHALKRGGHCQMVPLDFDTAETRYKLEPANCATPEQAFEKQWALTLLDSVLHHLREEYVQSGQAPLFDALKPCLLGSRESQPYAILATHLGMTEGAIKVAVHRMRERYRAQLKAQIAETVAAPEEIDQEIRHLFRVLAQS